MTMVKDVFGPSRWTDSDFDFDVEKNVLLPNGRKIWRHGIGTSGALLQAHLVLCRAQFLIYKTMDMKEWLSNLEKYPNEDAFYSPSRKSGALPTARGFCANIEKFFSENDVSQLDIPAPALDQLRVMRRYDAGRYAERQVFPAACRLRGISCWKASDKEDLEHGIDWYMARKHCWTVQVKLDSPATGNFFVQTHTNNDGWWGNELSAANE